MLRALAPRLLSATCLCAAVAFAVGCSGEPDTTTADLAALPPAEPDRTSWDATFRDDATVLDEATMALLANPLTDDGVYRFAREAGDAVLSLPPGRALLLPGVDIVRVKDVREEDVREEGGEIVLSTEAASLPDVVADGHASWNVGVDYPAGDPAAASPAASRGVRIQAAPAPTSKLVYNGPVGMFDVKGELKPEGDHVRLAGLVSFKNGNSILRVALDGKLARFRHAGEVTIRAGMLEAFYFEVSDLDLVLDMNLGGVALGKGNESFAIPIELMVPAMLGPVPVYFAVGAKFEVNPALGQTSSSRGKAHFVLKGSAGVAWSKADGLRKIGSLDGSEVAFTDYEGVSTLDSGLGVLAQFPIVKVGVGVSQGGAGAYVTQKTEVVTNMTMRYEAAGNFPVLTGNCFEANLNAGTYVGGDFRLAGFSFSKETPVWVKTNPLVKEGKACR